MKLNRIAKSSFYRCPLLNLRSFQLWILIKSSDKEKSQRKNPDFASWKINSCIFSGAHVPSSQRFISQLSRFLQSNLSRGQFFCMAMNQKEAKVQIILIMKNKTSYRLTLVTFPLFNHDNLFWATNHQFLD